MKLQIENSISQIAEKAGSRYREILSGARQRTENAAGTLSKGKQPVQAVSRLGLKLTAVSHKAVEGVLKQQTRLVEHQIDAVASGLHAAANANDFRALVGTQIKQIPQNASRFATDARDTLRIVAGAGQQVRTLLKGTVAEWRAAPQSAKSRGKAAAKPVRKTAKKAAKKAGKKAATRKTSGNKPVAAASRHAA